MCCTQTCITPSARGHTHRHLWIDHTLCFLLHRWGDAGLDEELPRLHGLVWVDLLTEKENELISGRGGELITMKFEVLHPTRLKILANLLEIRSQELKTVLQGVLLTENDGQIFVHALTDNLEWVVLDVLHVCVCGAEMGVLSTKAMEKDWDLQCLDMSKLET